MTEDGQEAVGIYPGSDLYVPNKEGHRGISSSWRWESDDRFERTPYDEALVSLAESALAEGRKYITMVDFGAGDLLGILTTALNEPKAFPQLRALLRAHSDFQVRMLGITDAHTKEEFGTQIPVYASSETALSDDTTKQIHAFKVPYSVTYGSQRLRDCLGGITNPDGSSLNENGVDLITSNYALHYFWPETIGQIAEDMAVALRSGGYALIDNWDPFTNDMRLPTEKTLGDPWAEKQLREDKFWFTSYRVREGTELELARLKELTDRHSDLDVRVEPSKFSIHKIRPGERTGFQYFPQIVKTEIPTVRAVHKL